MEAFAGVTAIDCSVGAVTVNVVEPDTDPRVAVIVLVPAVTPVLKPVPEIVATVVVPEFQVTELVRFCVLLSL